jgi:hypothetical protein
MMRASVSRQAARSGGATDAAKTRATTRRDHAKRERRRPAKTMGERSDRPWSLSSPSNSACALADRGRGVIGTPEPEGRLFHAKLVQAWLTARFALPVEAGRNFCFIPRLPQTVRPS